MKYLGKFRRSVMAVLVVAAFGWLAATPASAQTKLEVAYIPIMPMTQLFILDQEGWAKEAGLDLKLTKFSSGPAIVQAIASGKFDVIYFGIGPAMVARANGIPIKVVAANGIEQIAMIAQGDFRKYIDEAASPAEGVRKFTADKGRKPKIASLPKGSVPDTVFRHWLIKIAGLTEKDVDIVGMGAGKVQQAMLSRSVDGASILEPIITIIKERLPDAGIIATGGDMLPKQPGAIVAVREKALADHPEAIKKLVALHKRATDLITSDPERAAKDVHAAIGQGLVPVETIQAALQSRLNQFIADPRLIIAATKTMHDFQAEIGALKKPVPLDELFDTSIYEAVVSGK
ncbi:MAG: NitT/TauT family transport system substrate-binding protein [Alphaproteobacteria bacterium]|jgi:NitT/TauT family transport system substrate-binding protein